MRAPDDIVRKPDEHLIRVLVMVAKVPLPYGAPVEREAGVVTAARTLEEVSDAEDDVVVAVTVTVTSAAVTVTVTGAAHVAPVPLPAPVPAPDPDPDPLVPTAAPELVWATTVTKFVDVEVDVMVVVASVLTGATDEGAPPAF